MRPLFQFSNGRFFKEVIVKILSIVLFAFSLLSSVYARDGALYYTHHIDFSSTELGVGEGLSGNVIAVNGDDVREGTMSISNRGVFGDLGAGLGYYKVLSDSIRVRLEGGLRWMRFKLDNPTYSHVDFAVPISANQVNALADFKGTADAIGFRGGAFVDFKKLSGRWNSFIYLGSSYGLVDMKAGFDSIGPSLNGGDSTNFITAEFGVDAGGFRLGYEFTRFGEANLAMTGGSALNITPGNRHIVKCGILSFFKIK